MFQKCVSDSSKSKKLETFSGIAEGKRTKEKERTGHENKKSSKTEEVIEKIIKREKEKKETSEESKETKSKPKTKAFD